MSDVDPSAGGPLPLAPGHRVIGIVATEGGAMAEAMFAVESAGGVSVLLRGPDDRERIDALGVSEVVTPPHSSGWITPAPITAGPADAPARVVYSSGTTGKPKAVLVTHGNIASTADRLIAEMEMDAGIREYIGVPLSYSFGLGRARAIAQLGGRYYVPPHGFDPSEIAEMLRTGEINAISAVPTLWRVLIANADLVERYGAGVRWIEIGSQAMTADEKRALRKLFPNARIVQHYGLTEASRATFLRIDACDDAELASVGRAGRGTEVAISEDGHIRIRGPHVAQWRLEDGRWQPLTGTDGWLTTGDLGHVEGGALFFDGRADDLINCGGTKVSPDGMERAIIAALKLTPEVADRIAVGRAPDALRGEAVLVAHEREAGLDDEAVRKAAAAALADQGLTVGSVLRVMKVETLPRTPTGKLLRRELCNLVSAEPVTVAPVTGATPAPATDDVRERLLGLWRAALSRDDVDPDKSFYDVGGDSLSAIGLALSMERAGFDPETARSIFEGRSISEIAAAMAPTATHDAAGAATDDVRERLLVLWRGALGRDDVDPDKSFYDVGGDSLSAIALALSMERAGFDPETARSIFEGRSIGEIAGAAAPAPTPSMPIPAAEPSPVTSAPRSNQIAILSEGLNLMKGWLVLCMVASHWLPFYLDRVGLKGSIAHRAIQPFLSMGSPTLGFCFGIGASVFFARQYRASSASLARGVRTGSLLLLAGMAIGVAMEVAARAVSGDAPDVGIVLEAIAGGPFLYFLLATLSLPLWVGRLENDRRTALRLFAAALAGHLLYEMGRRFLPVPASGDLAADALRSILVGHWGLAQMGAITLAGAGAGVLIEMMLARGKPLSLLAPVGLLLTAAGMVMALAANDFLSWFSPHENIIPWSAVTFAGLTFYVVGRTEAWKAAVQGNTLLRSAMEMAATVGILLFPIYIAQSLVYHGTVIVSRLTHVGFLVVLTALIVIWAIVTAYMVMRMKRLYFGRSKRA